MYILKIYNNNMGIIWILDNITVDTMPLDDQVQNNAILRNNTKHVIIIQLQLQFDLTLLLFYLTVI